MERSRKGLEGAGEWAALKVMLRADPGMPDELRRLMSYSPQSVKSIKEARHGTLPRRAFVLYTLVWFWERKRTKPNKPPAVPVEGSSFSLRKKPPMLR